ncbi:MAG: hypothetical protein KAW17_09710 [Candidatus Eisenbacteria sp.]|nr:hypothetical protein [Candidatus Eisenbacteria bacterium]
MVGTVQDRHRPTRPFVRVDFTTRSEMDKPATAQVVSVDTNKTLREAAGSFNLELKPRSRGDLRQWRTLQPNDAVMLSFDRDQATMLGIIDRVGEDLSVSPGGETTQRVTISGRDLGKVFLTDTVLYFPSLYSDASKGKWKEKFPLPEKMTLVTEFRGQPIPAAIKKICTQMPVFNTPLGDGRLSVQDLLDWEEKVETYPEDLVYNEALGQFTGAIWNYLETVLDLAFYQCYVDTNADRANPKAHLIVRPYPFDKTGDFTFANARTFVHPTQQYHRLSPGELIRYTVSKSDADTRTVFQVFPEGWIIGADDISASFAPLIADGEEDTENLTDQYGFRPLIVRCHTLPVGAFSHLDDNDNVLLGGNTSAIEHIQTRRQKLYDWHYKNADFYSGSIIIRGRPEIRIGDWVHAPWTDRTYYVEGVGNTWRQSSPFTTALTVTRGEKGRV